VKKIFTRTTALSVLALGTVALVAQVYAPKQDKSLISYVYENFEGTPQDDFDLRWSSAGLKDVMQMKSYENTPFALGEWRKDTTNCLGINASFARKGNNWLDIVPKKFKPFVGKVQNLSIWVWGGNFAYDLEYILEDYMGFYWNIPAGNLKYYGWKNLSSDIAASIPQEEPYIPHRRGLALSKLRMYANPSERADRFHIFFDYMKVVTDTHKGLYDGVDLEQKLHDELYGDIMNGGTKSQPAKK
jgi:Flagellar filament outer layer protein Flaa